MYQNNNYQKPEQSRRGKLKTNKISVKFISHVSTAGTETAVDYQQSGSYQFAYDSNNATVGIVTTTVTSTTNEIIGTNTTNWVETSNYLEVPDSVIGVSITLLSLYFSQRPFDTL